MKGDAAETKPMEGVEGSATRTEAKPPAVTEACQALIDGLKDPKTTEGSDTASAYPNKDQLLALLQAFAEALKKPEKREEDRRARSASRSPRRSG
eukprot:5301843-Alexandrium_andersonii.AAC.1